MHSKESTDWRIPCRKFLATPLHIVCNSHRHLRKCTVPAAAYRSTVRRRKPLSFSVTFWPDTDNRVTYKNLFSVFLFQRLHSLVKDKHLSSAFFSSNFYIIFFALTMARNLMWCLLASRRPRWNTSCSWTAANVINKTVNVLLVVRLH